MGLLGWLGLRRDGSFGNLEAVMRELRKALPDDEACVLRYIAIVTVLLGKVAHADGEFSEAEEKRLRALLEQDGRLSGASVEAICGLLRGKVPSLSRDELDACYRELRGLCDGSERAQVMRLLNELAALDGTPSTRELNELADIARALGVEANPPADDASNRS